MRYILRMNRFPFFFLILLALMAASSAHATDFPFTKGDSRIDKTTWYTSHGWANGEHQACEWRAEAMHVVDEVLKITLSENTEGHLRAHRCGELQGMTKPGYGTYSARIKAAKGAGLNTAFFTYIGPAVNGGDHSEIDFEFLGKDPRTVQLNYFIKGGIAQDGTIIQLGFDASADFHEYSFTWEPHRIRWYIDGKQVHETKPGVPIPDNPGRIYLSLWAGAKPMDDWLGKFVYTAPVSAEFTQVKFTPLVD